MNGNTTTGGHIAKTHLFFLLVRLIFAIVLLAKRQTYLPLLHGSNRLEDFTCHSHRNETKKAATTFRHIPPSNYAPSTIFATSAPLTKRTQVI